MLFGSKCKSFFVKSSNRSEIRTEDLRYCSHHDSILGYSFSLTNPTFLSKSIIFHRCTTAGVIHLSSWSWSHGGQWRSPTDQNPITLPICRMRMPSVAHSKLLLETEQTRHWSRSSADYSCSYRLVWLVLRDLSPRNSGIWPSICDIAVSFWVLVAISGSSESSNPRGSNMTLIVYIGALRQEQFICLAGLRVCVSCKNLCKASAHSEQG